jgi:hypothetical protein
LADDGFFVGIEVRRQIENPQILSLYPLRSNVSAPAPTARRKADETARLMRGEASETPKKP